MCDAIQVLPWRNISSADNSVKVLNEFLFQLVGRYVRTKIIRVSNKDKPWRALGLGLTGKSLSAVK